jgi:flagellar FliL protein
MSKLPPDGSPGDLSPLERDDQVIAQETASAKAAQKVSLDLDDAPFLQEDPSKDKEDHAAKAPEPTKQIADQSPSSEEKKSFRKPIIFSALAVLILAAATIFWLIKPAAPPLPDTLPAPSGQTEITPPRPGEYYVELKPFWVAFDQGNEVRFLSLEMTLVTEDPTLYLEIQHKTITLRDAAYYFLSNRPLPNLNRVETADSLRKELLSVLNQHLSRPLSAILFEEFLVQ